MVVLSSILGGIRRRGVIFAKLVHPLGFAHTVGHVPAFSPRSVAPKCPGFSSLNLASFTAKRKRPRRRLESKDVRSNSPPPELLTARVGSSRAGVNSPVV